MVAEFFDFREFFAGEFLRETIEVLGTLSQFSDLLSHLWHPNSAQTMK